MRHPSGLYNEALRAECGKRTDKLAIATWLKKNHAARVIARFGAEAPAKDLAARPWACRYTIPIHKESPRVLEARLLDTPRAPPWMTLALPASEKADALVDPRPAFPYSAGDKEPEVENDAEDILLEQVADAKGPVDLSLVRKRSELRRLRVYRENLERQKTLRKEIRTQLKRRYPQMPLVKGERQHKGHKPRTPAAMEKDSPDLLEAWPYGTTSMFRNKLTPEMKQLAAAYIAEHILPSNSVHVPETQAVQHSAELRQPFYGRIAPVLRMYACSTPECDFGDAGDIEEGEDPSMVELKRLGVISDEVLLETIERKAGEGKWNPKMVEGLRDRVRKRKRGAEGIGRESKKLRLLRPLLSEGKRGQKRGANYGEEAPRKRRRNSRFNPATIEEDGGSSSPEPEIGSSAKLAGARKRLMGQVSRSRRAEDVLARMGMSTAVAETRVQRPGMPSAAEPVELPQSPEITEIPVSPGTVEFPPSPQTSGFPPSPSPPEDRGDRACEHPEADSETELWGDDDDAESVSGTSSPGSSNGERPPTSPSPSSESEEPTSEREESPASTSTASSQVINSPTSGSASSDSGADAPSKGKIDPWATNPYLHPENDEPTSPAPGKPAFFLPKVRSPSPDERELRPSEFSLNLREEERKARAKTGVLAANMLSLDS